MSTRSIYTMSWRYQNEVRELELHKLSKDNKVRSRETTGSEESERDESIRTIYQVSQKKTLESLESKGSI